MLRLVREGGDRRALSAEQFDGKGSWGNGAAMRVAPLGAWFAGDPTLAARMLGNGRQVTSHDTVPFTLWVAARRHHDYEAAMWTTAAAGGDVDSTCAIVGGIVAASGSTPLPPQWRGKCEPLPGWAGAPPLDHEPA